MKLIRLGLIGLLLFSCSNHDLNLTEGVLKIEINEGNKWIHPYPLFLGINKDNPPQFALWAEDLEGNYLSTLLVTETVSKNNWKANKGNRRVESLPNWTFARNIKDNDGTLMPSADNPVSDGVTTATPKKGFVFSLEPGSSLREFVLKFEVNHSTDFNNYFPKDAKKGEDNYSGGKDGSGQPALLYSKLINLDKEDNWSLDLVGYSSPDGSTNTIYSDLSIITTALEIVESVNVYKVLEK